MKDDFLIQQLFGPNGQAAGFTCKFKLLPATDDSFMALVAPFIFEELSKGRIYLSQDGRTYYTFLLNQGKGELFKREILVKGRYVTEQELIEREAREINNKEIQDLLIVPFQSNRLILN